MQRDMSCMYIQMCIYTHTHMLESERERERCKKIRFSDGFWKLEMAAFLGQPTRLPAHCIAENPHQDGSHHLCTKQRFVAGVTGSPLRLQLTWDFHGNDRHFRFQKGQKGLGNPCDRLGGTGRGIKQNLGITKA